MKSTKTNKNGVWYAELERFGYTLQTVAGTEKEAKDALLAEYIKAFKRYNDGQDPRRYKEFFVEDRTCYEIAEEEIYTTFMEFGKVEWN